MKKTNHHLITTTFNTLLLAVFSMTANAQTTCGGASLTNSLEIQVACLRVGNEIFSTVLQNTSATDLTWQWGGQLTPASCTADAAQCTDVMTDLSLLFNNIDIGGLPFRVELAHAPDVGEFAWRYRSHSALTEGSTTTPVLSTAALQRLRRLMPRFVGTTGQVPGAVLALAQGNSIIFMEAFGVSNTSTDTPLTTDNLFHIASTNKPVTSFLIAALVDEGVLQWDTRAIDIYPGFATSDPAASASITIRQLLDMTSGLPREGNVDTSEPARALFDRLSEQTLVGTPGAQYQYSNLGISLAGYLGVLAKVKATNGTITDADLDNLYSGYNTLLQEKVLTPIGMSNSYLSANAASATGLLSQSHELANGSFVVTESVDVDPDNAAPSGGLKSTVGDMINYIITEMQQGLSPTGTRVVSTANIAERQKLSTGPAAEENYGLSIEVSEFNGLDYIGHTGSFDNFNSVMGFFPQKQLGFVLLTNGESPDALELTETTLPETLATLLGAP